MAPVYVSFICVGRFERENALVILARKGDLAQPTGSITSSRSLLESLTALDTR